MHNAPRVKLLPLLLGVLVGVLSVLFWFSFLPGNIVASNDGPLGAQVAQCRQLPGIFFGAWNDLNSIGVNEGSAFPGVTYGLSWLLGPTGFAKFFAPLSILFLGLAASCFFRQIGLASGAAVLGGLAMALNSGFFSDACWGTAAHLCSLGMNLLALAALSDQSSSRPWLRVVLAGLAVGVGVMDGADIGVLLSLLVALAGIYQAITWEGPTGRNLGLAVGRVAVVTVCALILAAEAVSVLVSTQIQGVSTFAEERTKEEKWAFATQWSLPKKEALVLAIPGLFGYRTDTPRDMAFLQSSYRGGAYWGAVGSDLSWDLYFSSGKQIEPHGTTRFTGGGNYAGILVDLVAVWAVAQSLRKKNSVFSLSMRKWIWFWAVVGFASLLLAFGRFAPFYQLIHPLPFFSSIRNPGKFLIFVDLSIVVLFAYGIHGLWERYMGTWERGAGKTGNAGQPAPRRDVFDTRWKVSCLAALGAGLLGYLVYASSRQGVLQYLQDVQIEADSATAIADFSLGQVRWFLLFFTLAIVLVLSVIAGRFKGAQARRGLVLLGTLLVVDLARANLAWIIRWDVPEKYASNAIVDFFREKPHEHRVSVLPFPAPRQFAALGYLYGLEWVQHLFQYYNVQSLDVVQMPRPTRELEAFQKAMGFDGTSNTLHHISRRWQLTNTRYLLGAAGFLDVLNQQLDPKSRGFLIRQRFDIAAKPGSEFDPTNPETWTAVPNTNGSYAVFEFTGALPRVRLYTQWQVNTNDAAVLERIASPSFEADKTVFVSQGPPSSENGAASHALPGAVEYESYAPKRVVLRAETSATALLLLNDKYDRSWKVTVDGQPQELLRANFIMRGVVLPKGSHRVEFRFEPPLASLYVSLAAIGLGVLLCGWVVSDSVRTGARAAAVRSSSGPR
jgi:hypothetical protein